MKRAAAFLLCIIISISFIPSGQAAHGRATAVTDFETSDDFIAFDGGGPLTFTARIFADGGRADAFVYDDAGNKCATLHDDGRNGDVAGGDGIYTAVIDTDVKEKRTVTYHVEADGLKSAEKSVSYYHMMTTKELVQHEKFWSDAENYRQSLRDGGKAPHEVLRLMYDYVKSNKYVKADTVSYADDNAFTFEFIWGSGGCIEEYETAENGAGRDFSGTEQITRTIENASWQNPDVMVFRPYRSSPNMGDFANEFYTGAARAVCDITGGEMRDFTEHEASPANLKDIDKYGFFIIDSHGIKYNEKSYMMMRIGDTSGYDYAEDLSAGHIISSGFDVGVTGSFFTKYIKNQGKQMPDTLLYIVVCYGMATDTICDPAIDCGAQLVFGYTDSVSFDWDFEFSETLLDTFVSVHPDHPGRTYTFGEAMDEAIRVNGSVDPYSVNNGADRGSARPRAKGNTDFVLWTHIDASPVIGFRILNSSIDLYAGESAKIQYQVISEGNTRYRLHFISDDESIAKADEKGNVTMLSTKAEEQTGIKAVLTDLSDLSNPKDFTAECRVKSKGKADAEGIALDTETLVLYEGMQGAQIKAHVLPEYAYDKQLEYKSLDEKVVTVSETGFVTPLAEGCTYVRVIIPSSQQRAFVQCVVKKLTLREAINAQGGQREVTCSGEYPFVPATDSDGVPYAVSSNQKKDNTLSAVILYDGELEKGSFITFEWKVSSEWDHDCLDFFVNGNAAEKISGETGWTTVRYEAEKDGFYNFIIAYSKDGAGSLRTDTAYVRNFELYRAGEKHTVTFYDMDGHTVLKSVSAEHGGKVVPPNAPEHMEYYFVGWSVNTDRVLSDLTVYAQYGYAPSEPAHVMLGDVNTDGKINTADAVAVLKYSAGIIQLDETHMQAANVNKDSRINTADAVLILKFAAGMIMEF